MIKVLLVDDEKLLRRGLHMTVPWNEYGCEIVGEASNAIDGEEMILRYQPDIVITDVSMPQMSGLEMIERLEGRISCEYIIISGYDKFEYAKQAVRMGVKGYLLKPIDDNELKQVILKTVKAVKDKREYLQMMNQVKLRDVGLSEFDGTFSQLAQGNGKDKYLEQAFQYIRDHCDSELTLKNVADNLYISESYLGKLFRNKKNYTFVEVLTVCRMKKAMELLAAGSDKIYEIAQFLGYKDTRYFSAVFRKVVGMTPTEYRALQFTGTGEAGGKFYE